MTDPLPNDRVGVYLDDVARRLTDLDPGERAEILAGLREHLAGALAEGPQPPTAADVGRVLDELGPPEDVAAAALADLDRGSAHGPRSSRPVGRSPVLSRAWMPAVVGALLVLGCAVVLGPALVAAVRLAFNGAPADGSVMSAELLAVGAGAVLGLPVWALAAGLMLTSPLWAGAYRLLGVLLLPGLVLATAVVLGVAGSALLNASGLVPVAGVLVLAAAASWSVVKVWRSGAARAPGASAAPAARVAAGR